MIRDLLPARARFWIYTTISTVAGVESVLDGFDYGVIPTKPQAAALAVVAFLGFGLAAGNTNRQ